MGPGVQHQTQVGMSLSLSAFLPGPLPSFPSPYFANFIVPWGQSFPFFPVFQRKTFFISNRVGS